MSKAQAVYKVVRRKDGDKLVSAMMTGQLQVTYPVGRRAHSLNGAKLFAFAKKADAEYFVRSNYHSEIWRATATGVKPLKWRIYDWTRKVVVLNFWRRFAKGGDVRNHWCRTPEGTVACDTIVLRERLTS